MRRALTARRDATQTPHKRASIDAYQGASMLAISLTAPERACKKGPGLTPRKADLRTCSCSAILRSVRDLGVC